MESDKSVKLSTEEKGEIFEYVNTMYLHLKGQKKKQTKQSFKTSWKEDNMCYILMMKLNDVYETWSEKEQHEDWEFDRDVIKNSNEKSISMIRHKRNMNFMRMDLEDKEKELDKIKEGKGYISQESHDEAMKEQKQELQEIIREQGDKIAKLRQSEEFARDAMNRAKEKEDEVRKYYENQMDILIKGQVQVQVQEKEQ
tara:strand:+ start:699 stop:1292 length:594 start_codon:yes stop_codon:yes gene_type:complete